MRRAKELRVLLSSGNYEAKKLLFQKVIQRITVGQGSLTLESSRRALAELLLDKTLSQNDAPDTISIVCPFSMRRRGIEVRMVLTDGSAGNRKPDPVLINLLKQAHLYLQQLTDGQSRI